MQYLRPYAGRYVKNRKRAIWRHCATMACREILSCMNGGFGMRHFATVLLMLAALVGTAGAEATGSWRVVKKERGITVSARDEPNRNLPTMRGEGTIRGNVLHVLAVVLDAKGSTEWAEGVDDMKIIREVDAHTLIFRSLTDTPWPVSDRDMLMRRTISVQKVAEEFHIRLLCAPKELPRVDGVVRVVDCDSYFHLRKVDADHTFIDYQINLDPGGHLPTWLVRWASTKVPYETLVNLENQVSKTKGHYDRVMKAWSTAS